MELYQLRSFVVVAEEGHLTRASERLFASQPTVSAHIKALEEELGVSLFTRDRRGMHITEEGRLLLEKAEKVLSSANALMNQARELQGELVGSVKLGLSSNPSILRVTDFFSSMTSEYPRLELHLIQSISSRVLKYVKNREFDAGFFLGKNPLQEIKAFLLSKVSMVVAGPAGFKERLDEADVEDLYKLPWVWRTACGPFHRCGNDMFCNQCFKDSKSIVAEDYLTMKSLIMGGAGLGLMEENEALAEEKEGRLAIWPRNRLEVDLSLVYLEKREKDPVIRAMLEGARKTWGLVEKAESHRHLKSATRWNAGRLE